MSYPDDSLENRLLHGEPEALGLVSRWIAGALAARRYWRLRTEWKDLAQEILTRVLDSLRRERYRHQGGFRAYVEGVCRFTALQRLAALVPTGDDPALDEIQGAGPESDPERTAMLRQLVRMALDGASDECRSLIRSYYLEERSYSDLATELGVPVGTVKSRLSRCLICVREALNAAGPQARTSQRVPILRNQSGRSRKTIRDGGV